MRTVIIAAVVCLSLVDFGSAHAAPAVQARIETQIRPQDLSSALKQFAEVRDMQVLYLSASIKHLKTKGASGDLTANETLHRLLSGTGLAFQYVDPNTVTLLAAGANAPQAHDFRSAAKAKEGKRNSSDSFHLARTRRTASELPAPLSATNTLQQPVLKTIIVTAEKRSQSAQSVPVSLTVLTGQQLFEQGMTNVAQIAQQVPGLAVQRTGPGENTIIIDGVSSQAGVASTTGYYYGDVPLSQSEIDLPFFDINNVEVLRGPQGTLYGSSSMGGTIKYVPNQPKLNHWSATFDLGTNHIDDSYGLGHKINAVINFPLVHDRLAARVLLWNQYNRGYISRYAIPLNNYLGVGALLDRGANSSDYYGFQIQLKYKPWKNVTILPLFLTQKIVSQGLSVVDLPESNLNTGYIIQTADLAEPHHYNASIANLDIHASFNDVNLVSSTSYFATQVNTFEDSSKTQYVLLGLAPPDPVEPLYVQNHTVPRELVEELRVSNTRGHAFEGTIGLYYDRLITPFYQNIPFTPQWVAAYGNPVTFFGNPFPLDNTIFYGASKSENTEKAVFGQATYHITHKLSATVGLRYSYYDVSETNIGFGLANGPPTSFAASAHFSGISPKYNIAYQLTPDAMVYATAAKGIRTGSIQAPSPSACLPDLAQLGITSSPDEYLPDSLWSYELGAKTLELDRRMSVNGSVYYIDWTNVQQTVALECGFPFTGNLGKAAVKGGTLEISAIPIAQVKLYASIAYTDSRLKNTVPGTGSTAGEPLLLVPEWTAAVSAEYRHAINENLLAFFRLQANYESKVYRVFNQADFFRIAPSSHVVNIRFGVLDADDRWDVTAYITNLLNTFSQDGLRLSDTGADLPTTRPVSILQPRTFGLDVVYRWGQK